MRRRVENARVARLATADREGAPHVVPITFALTGDRLVWAIDHKPKTTVALKRLRNISEQPRVSVLVDHYADDWAELWWVRIDGTARIVEDDPACDSAVAMLVAKYQQYRDHPPAGPVIEIAIERWSGWTA